MHKQCLIFNLLCLFQVKINTRQIETQDIIKAFKGSRHAQTLNVYEFQSAPIFSISISHQSCTVMTASKRALIAAKIRDIRKTSDHLLQTR